MKYLAEKWHIITLYEHESKSQGRVQQSRQKLFI